MSQEESGPDTLGTGRPALPAALETARRILYVIGRIELTFAVLGLVAVVVISAAQTFMRYSNLGSLWWAQEVAQLTIVVTYFFGVSYVFKARQYILIEFLSLKLSVAKQLVLYILAQILTIAFAATCVILVIRFAPRLMEMTTPTLGLPDLLRSVPLAIASTMMVVTSLYYLAFGIWAVRSGVPGHSLHEIEDMALVARMPRDEDL